MKTSDGNDSILYAIVAGFLRGAFKGLALAAAFFIARDHLANRSGGRDNI